MITLEEIVSSGNLRKTVHALSSIEGHDGSVVGNIFNLLQASTTPEPQATLYPVLHCIAARFRPRRYLEIGIAKAFSTVVVAAAHLAVDMIGIDLWGSALNIPLEAVKERVNRAGHTGDLTLLKGSSRELVSPSLGWFNLILVDGDHRPDAIRADLDSCAALLSSGGYLVADDVFANRECESVWDAFKASQPTWEWLECRRDPGVGIGRRSA